MLNIYFVLLMKSHLQSYPSPLIKNYFWNLGFLLGIHPFIIIAHHIHGQVAPCAIVLHEDVAPRNVTSNCPATWVAQAC